MLARTPNLWRDCRLSMSMLPRTTYLPVVRILTALMGMGVLARVKCMGFCIEM